MCHLDCVLNAMFEGEPSAPSDVLNSLDQGFRYYILLHLAQTSLLVPAAEKHPHSIMLPLSYVTRGMLKMKAKKFNPSDQRILFLTVWESFRCFFKTPFGLSVEERRLALYLSISHWGQMSVRSPIQLRLVQCCIDGWPSETFSHLYTGSLELIHIGFLITSLT